MRRRLGGKDRGGERLSEEGREMEETERERENS